MPVDYGFKKGIDTPIWQWLPQQLTNYNGCASAYDGSRYIYWVIQTGSATANSSTALYRFCTWTSAWQNMVTLTSGSGGADITYDAKRNALYLMIGGVLTTWYVFNLNTASITVLGTACPAFSLTSMPVVLPAASSNAASLTMTSDTDIPAQIDTGTVASATTTVITSSGTGTFHSGLIGCQLNFLTGTLAGTTRIVSAVTNANTLTLSAATGSAAAAGDTFELRLPQHTATGTFTATTLTIATAEWTTNYYAGSDVVIVSGTGSGQRRRISSNSASGIILNAAVTGNANTGPWTTTPDSTSVFRIVPSSDFLYYQPGGGATAFYRIDLSLTASPAWTVLSAISSVSNGGNVIYMAASGPFQMIAHRGQGTTTLYTFNIGLNTWTQPVTFWASEAVTTGGSICMIYGKRKLAVFIQNTTRLYIHDLTTGVLEPAGTLPFVAPAAYDGKRIIHVRTPDGASFLYLMRAGGMEFYRMPLEWL